jgi:hypothetical protein
VNIVGSIMVHISVYILLHYFFGIEEGYLFVDCNSIHIMEIIGGMGVRMVDTYFVNSVEIKSLVKMVKNSFVLVPTLGFWGKPPINGFDFGLSETV